MSPINQRSARINKAGLFSRWQPQYAAHKVATFPVLITEEVKRPAVTNYGKVGLPGSAELASKRQFADANAFGFMTGPRSKITVLDVDTTDETILANAIDQHGQSPLVVRSASGKFHAYYRHNGERRRIRPWRGLPIDVLGSGGYVVAPPSKSAKGQYEIIQGGLDDLEHLPVMRNLAFAKPEIARDGERGIKLFEHLMRAAHHVDCFDDLLDVGRTFGDNCEPPMEDARVISTAHSVWGYTLREENRFGRHGAWFPLNEVNRLVDDQDAFFLLAFLRAHQGPDATFMCANGLAEKFGWTRKRFANARLRLIERGLLQARSSGGIPKRRHVPMVAATKGPRMNQTENGVAKIDHLYSMYSPSLPPSPSPFPTLQGCPMSEPYVAYELSFENDVHFDGHPGQLTDWSKNVHYSNSCNANEADFYGQAAPQTGLPIHRKPNS